MTTLQYESPAERAMSIAHAAELRDAVDAYRASCVTRYPEEQSQSDEWFASRGVEPTPLREPSKMFTEHDKRWLKEHEGDLPKEGDGRDSTNIQPYAYFADSSNAKTESEKERDDLTSDDYSDQLNKDEIDVESRLTREDQERGIEVDPELEPEADPNVDSLIIDSADDESESVELIIDTEFVENFSGISDTSEFASTFSQHLAEAIADWKPKREPKREREVLTSLTSGDLKSSWSLVEAQSQFYNEQGRRHQFRGDTETPPEFVYRSGSRPCIDEGSGRIVTLTRAMFDSPEMRVLDSLRRRFAHKSEIRWVPMREAIGHIYDAIMDEALPTISVRRPDGPVRKFSRDVLQDIKHMSWRRASAYCAKHVEAYRLWLEGGEFELQRRAVAKRETAKVAAREVRRERARRHKSRNTVYFVPIRMPQLQ
jgi:hypothetical protein